MATEHIPPDWHEWDARHVRSAKPYSERLRRASLARRALMPPHSEDAVQLLVDRLDLWEQSSYDDRLAIEAQSPISYLNALAVGKQHRPWRLGQTKLGAGGLTA